MVIENSLSVVTGAGGGIGKLLTQRLLKAGGRVIAVDRDVSLITDLLLDYRNNELQLHASDFTDTNSLLKLSKEISSNNSKIDFLFNVAGIGIYKNVEDLTTSDWVNTMSINVNAPFVLTRDLLPALKKSAKPMVFNVGSGMGVFPSGGRTSYCASKFALRGLSLSLNKELKDKGIDICLLTLGSVMTSFGTGGLELRKRLEKDGKKYLDPVIVIDKIIEIATSEVRSAEYELYPEGYP
jgi:short-subunit dehydrogenase